MPLRRPARGGTAPLCGTSWRFFAAVMALAAAVYVIGPLVYWNFIGGGGGGGFSIFRPYDCPACSCDCLGGDLAAVTTPLSGLGNISLADCLKEDFRASRGDEDADEIRRLTEELKLQQAVSEENQHKSQLAFLEAKRLSSLYMKEAEKCTTGMETSEKTQAKAEATLAAGRRATALWEARARAAGWKDNKEGPFRIPVDDPFEAGASQGEGDGSDAQTRQRDPGASEGAAAVARKVKSWRPRR